MPDPHDRLDELRIDRSAEETESPWPRRLLLLALAVLLVGLAGWWYLGRDRGFPVEIVAPAAPAAGAGVSVLDASGYVVARREATVSSKVTGRVAAVLVEEGMEVEEGQLLARLDDANARRELGLAEARFAAARSRVGEVEVLLREAELDLSRTRELHGAGAESQADLDAALSARDALAARLAATRDEVVVAEREAALRRQMLEDTRIRAPFDGVAISKDAQPGEMISPVSAGGGFTRTGITTIVDMGSLEIEVDVNEAYIQRVRPGQRVEATLDAYPAWKIPAHVITTVPAADRQKATVKVRIGFDELGDPRILPDMGVKVAFQAAEVEKVEKVGEGGSAGARGSGAAAPGALLLPRSAVRREGETAVVFVVRNGTVERRAVALGGGSEDRVEVSAGLRSTDRVVLNPPEGMADGDRVRVANRGGDE
ncbi:MAG: efflux RND transporter periplasmic adaptor subunit [Gemmatimonadota bacterium]